MADIGEISQDTGNELSEEDLQGQSNNGTREGTDDVLSRLDQTDPGAADLMRNMQQRMSRNINEFNESKAELSDLLLELRNAKAGNSTGEAPPEEEQSELPDGVSQDHMDMFEKMAQSLGYVKTDMLTQRDNEAATETYLQQALQQGVEEYGSAFGTVNGDGTVAVNPQAQGALRESLQRLNDPVQGITPLDLYRLAFPGGGSGQGRSGQNRQPRTQRGSAASTGVVNRTTGSGGDRVRIYDASRGDSPDDVFNRAWVMAKRNLST